MGFSFHVNSLFVNEKLIVSDQFSSLHTMVHEPKRYPSFDHAFIEAVKKLHEGLLSIPSHTPVFVLLPHNLSVESKSYVLQHLSQCLKRSDNEGIYDYPYGTTSFLMTLPRLTSVLEQSEEARVIGLEIFSEAIPDKESEIQVITSLLLGTVKPDRLAIKLMAIQQEKDLLKQKLEFGFLFKSLARKLTTQLDILSFPLSPKGIEDLWTKPLPNLSPWVTHSTQYLLSDERLNYLGCNLGPITFMLMQEKAKSGGFGIQTAFQLLHQPEGYSVGAILHILNVSKN